MISQVFSPIVERILIKLQMVLNHSWGWIISGMIFLLNFISPVIFTQDNAIITKAGCTLACVCELWSMLGSALIIWPNMMFPKLLKLQLKGEIESKLGKNISNQLDKEDCKNDNDTKGNPKQQPR